MPARKNYVLVFSQPKAEGYTQEIIIEGKKISFNGLCRLRWIRQYKIARVFYTWT